jgi:hypothetical protein
MDTLIEQFWGAGLIQFGRFEGVPFKLQFDLLPSYPDLWAGLIDRLRQQLDMTRYERLLTPADSVSLGTLLSYATNIPLVYSKGTGREGVYDLLGAYDVGHPALFVANIWTDNEPTYLALMQKARRVGLEVNTALVIMTYGKTISPDAHIHHLFRFEDVVMMLHHAQKLPIGQVNAVLEWIAQHA